ARADHAVLEPDPATQRERPRLLGEERVGARLDEEAVGLLGCDRAAEPRRTLDERHADGRAALGRELRQAVRRREAGDPAADDDDAVAGHARSASARTTLASIRMNAGWSFTAAARSNPSPSSAAVARASTSRSYSTSTWSQTKPIGMTTTD